MMSALGIFIPILIVIFSGLLWMPKGFFSAALHLVCTIVAGAIAFALWEPLSILLLRVAPTTGAGRVLLDSAWAVALGVTFSLAVILLRTATDSVIRKNANTSDQFNNLGGAVCGGLTGVICAGILTISLGTLRLGTQWPLSVTYNDEAEGRGSIVFTKNPMKPWVDVIVAKFYGMASSGALRPLDGISLAHQYPEGVHVMQAALRLTNSEGKGRNTLKPKDGTLNPKFDFVVGDPLRGSPLSSLLDNDKWGTGQHDVVDLHGNPIKNGYLVGLAVDFGPGARESGGGAQIQITNAQVRLLTEDADGNTRSAFPVAVYFPFEGSSTRVGRMRFDAGSVENPLVAASSGGQANAPFTFEFVVEPGFKPITLFVRGVRYDVSGMLDRLPDTQKLAKVTGSDGRDQWLSRTYDPEDTVTSWDRQGQVVTRQIRIRPDNEQRASRGIPLRDVGFTINNNLPFTLKAGETGGLGVQDVDGKNLITDGENTFNTESIKNALTTERSLQVRQFQVPDDVRLVHLDIGTSSMLGLFSPLMTGHPRNMPPQLVDTNGAVYEPIGATFQDQTLSYVRYTPSRPIRSINDLRFPPSQSNPDAKVSLIFRVSSGVQIRFYRIGPNFEVADFTETPIQIP